MKKNNNFSYADFATFSTKNKKKLQIQSAVSDEYLRGKYLLAASNTHKEAVMGKT